MSIRWLTVQSFQQSQALLAAINALSIHTKLELANLPDKEGAGAADEARETLTSFFDQLGSVVGQAEQQEDGLVLGADPRLRQLARSFVDAKRNRRRFKSELFRDKFARVKQLLYSDRKDDKRSLIECLADLRVLIEEHLQVDAERMLGDI